MINIATISGAKYYFYLCGFQNNVWICNDDDVIPIFLYIKILLYTCVYINYLQKKSLRIPWKHIFISIPMYAIMTAHIGVNIAFVVIFTEMPTYLEKGLGISLREVRDFALQGNVYSSITNLIYFFLIWICLLQSATFSGLPYAGMWFAGTIVSIISQKLYNNGVLSASGSRKIFNSFG